MHTERFASHQKDEQIGRFLIILSKKRYVRDGVHNIISGMYVRNMFEMCVLTCILYFCKMV